MRPGGVLLVVDYCRRSGQIEPPELGEEVGQPLVLETLTGMLADCGFRLEVQEDWTARFAGWYAVLLQRFMARRKDIIRLSGPDWHDFAVEWYGAPHQELLDQRLGGLACTAKANPSSPVTGE